MDQQRHTLWYEDLERHRQPSLYYLSSLEDNNGPHLVCDWNGAPTNFEEFDLDLMSKFIEAKPVAENLRTDKIYLSSQNFEDSGEIPAFAAPKVNKSSTTKLTEDDGSHMDFLTIPTLPQALLRRLLMKNFDTKSSIVTEEMEITSTHRSERSKIESDSKKRGRCKKEETVK